MKGIELTRAGVQSKDPVWIPLNSIVLVWPYSSFDGKENGSEIALINNGSVHVTESYTTIIELLNGYKMAACGANYVDDDESYA